MTSSGSPALSPVPRGSISTRAVAARGERAHELHERAPRADRLAGERRDDEQRERGVLWAVRVGEYGRERIPGKGGCRHHRQAMGGFRVRQGRTPHRMGGIHPIDTPPTAVRPGPCRVRWTLVARRSPPALTGWRIRAGLLRRPARGVRTRARNLSAGRAARRRARRRADVARHVRRAGLRRRRLPATRRGSSSSSAAGSCASSRTASSCPRRSSTSRARSARRTSAACSRSRSRRTTRSRGSSTRSPRRPTARSRCGSTTPRRAPTSPTRATAPILEHPAHRHEPQRRPAPVRPRRLRSTSASATAPTPRTARTPSVLLGKILRIARTRAVHDSPGQPSRRAPEIYAYGLRNPWRFSFDSLTGDLHDRRRRRQQLGGDRPAPGRAGAPARTSAGTAGRARTRTARPAAPPPGRSRRSTSTRTTRRTARSAAASSRATRRCRRSPGAISSPTTAARGVSAVDAAGRLARRHRLARRARAHRGLRLGLRRPPLHHVARRRGVAHHRHGRGRQAARRLLHALEHDARGRRQRAPRRLRLDRSRRPDLQLLLGHRRRRQGRRQRA